MSKEYRSMHFTGERPIYGQRGVSVYGSVFDSGESPIKECRDVTVEKSIFGWKYPLWYDKNVTVRGCTWLETARAGVWYTENISVTDAVISAPKNFRRCRGVTLADVSFTNAEETLWTCSDVRLRNVTAKGHYFAMNCSDMEIDGLRLDGNYAFDGTRNVVIRNSHLSTKDAFWNSENVVVENSFISGDYLGWNSRNLTLTNCSIESNQGLCYIENLKLVNCTLINTDLAFEFSDVDADVVTGLESVLNPRSGVIKANFIKELIIEPGRVSADDTTVICPDIGKRSESPEWLRDRDY
ncbi:MAG: DUF3737 family protein [Clostridia bacterium]|nr:DUF3737 family protein [Clostridia bacterium]